MERLVRLGLAPGPNRTIRKLACVCDPERSKSPRAWDLPSGQQQQRNVATSAPPIPIDRLHAFFRCTFIGAYKYHLALPLLAPAFANYPRYMAATQPQRLPPASPRAVPVINLGRLGNGPAARALVIQDIARACRKRGCFQVINHIVNKSVMKGALEAASEFFELSTEHKEEFASDDIRQPIRYDTSSRDGISLARSFLKHYANPLEDWVHCWPTHPPTYRKKMGEYAAEIQKVSVQLMEAILQGLGIGPSHLQDKLEKGVQFMALNNYPQFSHQGDKVGLAAHSDYGLITILLQSTPGLQVMHHDDDAWTAVPVIPGALHVHIGDQLEVLSNGQIKSLVHRAVLNPNEARISIASIHGLSMDEKVDCAEELVDEQHPRMYRGSSFQDFLDFLPSNINTNTYRRFVESLKMDRA